MKALKAHSWKIQTAVNHLAVYVFVVMLVQWEYKSTQKLFVVKNSYTENYIVVVCTEKWLASTFSAFDHYTESVYNNINKIKPPGRTLMYFKNTFQM